MEFDIESDKVIGVVDYELASGNGNARITVIGLLKENQPVMMKNYSERSECFPPKGLVFAPRFLDKTYHKVGDVISFFVEANKYPEPEKDLYILNAKPKTDLRYGIKVNYLKGATIQRSSIDLSNATINEDFPTTNFYGIVDDKLIGMLKMDGAQIVPEKFHRTHCWDLSDCELMEGTKGKILCLHKHPSGQSTELDCMDDNQLFKWFRDRFKELDPAYVKLLDQNSKWRDDFPQFFKETCPELEQSRFERVSKKIGQLTISVNAIHDFINKNESLRIVFKDAIETHKNEFKNIYSEDLNEFEKEINKKRIELNREIKDIEKQKKTAEKEIEKLSSRIKRLETETVKLSENKERIIEDYSVVKDVLGGVNFSVLEAEGEKSYVIEECNRNERQAVSTIEDFIIALKYQLNVFKLNPAYAKRLVTMISGYHAILLGDIRYGVAIAKATHNAKYVIKEVAPDWFHFKALWENGLGEMWKSAHDNPDIFHFFILEDINMSAPECYCRPLLDVISKVRCRIPFGDSEYPENLWIMATCASVDDPKIGLPLSDKYKDWGALGCKERNWDNEEHPNSQDSGYLSIHLLAASKPIEEEFEDLSLYVEREREKLLNKYGNDAGM